MASSRRGKCVSPTGVVQRAIDVEEGTGAADMEVCEAPPGVAARRRLGDQHVEHRQPAAPSEEAGHPCSSRAWTRSRRRKGQTGRDRIRGRDVSESVKMFAKRLFMTAEEFKKHFK